MAKTDELTQWHIYQDTSDGCLTWNVAFGINKDSVEKEAEIECRTQDEAQAIAELLNRLGVGPSSNSPIVQAWQAIMMKTREKEPKGKDEEESDNEADDFGPLCEECDRLRKQMRKACRLLGGL